MYTGYCVTDNKKPPKGWTYSLLRHVSKAQDIFEKNLLSE